MLVFLLTSLLARLYALRASGPTSIALALAIMLLAGACFVRRQLLSPALAVFGASFFLYGFHAYSVRSQLFELALTALALVLAARVPLRAAGESRTAGGSRAPLAFAAVYALSATVSLLLLPHRVLEHRAFLEAGDFVRAVLSALPMDPLYPVAGVARLWLYVVAVDVLAAQPDARELYRLMGRGVAWAAVVAVVLG